MRNWARTRTRLAGSLCPAKTGDQSTGTGERQQPCQGDQNFMEKKGCEPELAAGAASVLSGGCLAAHPGPHGAQPTLL